MMDLESIRERLSAQAGPRLWRSLEELAGDPAFDELVRAEFPAQASRLLDPVGRRDFLRLMAASLALAGLTGCTRQPSEEIVPYVKPPEEVVPGRPLFFATALPLGGVARGVLVESHMGRPTKVEGNPEHPASLGASDAFAQAAVLTLYDPDRSQVIRSLGEIRPWSAFVAAMRTAVEAQTERRGAGLRVLTGTVTSPTLAAQLEQLLADFPAARWHQHDPAARDNARSGAVLAFGQPLEAVHHLAKAAVVLSLDADFLSCGAAHLRDVRELSARRRPGNATGEMSRLYVVESTLTVTGAKADHRLAVRAVEVEDLARALAAELGIPVRTPAGLTRHADWVKALARDLQKHRGECLVIAGDGQPPFVHALAHVLNQQLGNAGQTVTYIAPIEPRPVDHGSSLAELVRDMAAGAVEVLLILGANPVYDAPVDLEFGRHLEKVGLRVHHGIYADETAALCHWHVPEAHPLEAWSDLRAFDGTVTILQPLIAPLYGGKTAHEIIATLSERPERTSYDIVREHWKGRMGGDFESAWRRALHDGVVAGTAEAPRAASLQPDWDRGAAPAPPARGGLEIVFRLDPAVHDGAFANNGWLQELPRPISKITWDNAALFAPATAERFGLGDGDVVELRYEGRAVRAPVCVLPGQPRDSITVHLGYGRTRAGRVGNGVGFNAYALRTAGARWFGSGLEVLKTGEHHPLVRTQNHHSMENRHLVRSATLEYFRAHPHFAAEMEEEPSREQSLYPEEHRYEGYAWGMVIDLNACTGCNACVVACQSENNIPVVGKTEVARGREMHWIRIDRYFEGDLDEPRTHHQPVPCMHCENAPCEVVCPVGATVHSSEGLNDMVYNRCVGTKYCSNNCPYKVRRFNFFKYQDWATESLKMMRNPDVTVRSYGVMEKCTYCVQRINAGRIEAKEQGRRIRDGEVMTACQQVCPAEAIVFGDLNDPDSRVARLRAGARHYGLLAALNTRPRTTYLASLRNPNPEIDKGEA